MLRLSHDQPTLWESVLPPELFEMNEELAEVDRILDDERFFAPFRERFDTRVGRPTIPVATYLRMMYLKRRYKLGYETLVKEVRDSFTWRRFCHLSLKDRVPDDTTLIKLSHKYGESFRGLFDAEGNPKAYVVVLVNGQNMALLDGMETALKAGDVVAFATALSGG